jgi:hypothetical protein
MIHLTDDELRSLARPAGHLTTCAACRLRWDSWQRLTGATRQAAMTLAPDVTHPAFDTLLAALKPADPVPTLTLKRSWRTTGLLVFRQLRLMPRLLVPLSLTGLAVAVAVALVTPDPQLASRYFAAGVELVSLLGALVTCTRRADPRTELLCALPISPVTVFTARLVLVLAADVLLALAGSAVVHAVSVETSVFDIVTDWLGQSLLASAIAVVGAVRFSTGIGAAAAVAAWCLGSFTTLSRGGLAEHVGRVAGEIWGTTPWTAAVALALFVLAVRQVQRLPERPREFA